MIAVLCKAFGAIDGLVVEDIPEPLPGAGELRVVMQACGINFPDVLLVQGKYQYKPPLPFSPGSEFCGIVDAAGEGVSEFKAGDRVCGWAHRGGLAEKLIVEASELCRVPDNVDSKVAAAFHVTYGTSLYALRNRGNLKSGETLLVLGAGGGVGIAAVELGALLGARVVAAASSDEKLALARARGAAAVVKYPTGRLDRDAMKELTSALKAAAGGDGFNVIYDPIGGDYAEPALRSIAWEGRYLVVGFAAGEIPRIPLNLTLLKGCQIVGVIWGGHCERVPSARREFGEELMGLIAAGRLKPQVSGVFPLERASEAIQTLADRRAVGKVVVTAKG